MSETRYTISEAAKRLKVESHVLRYWEEELDLDIPRNDMGHRFYRASDMKRFEDIQFLKERGFQLKSLKTVLPNADLIRKMDKNSVETLKNEVNQKVAQEEELARQVAAADTEDEAKKPDGNRSLLPKNQGEETKAVGEEHDPEYRMRQFRLMMNSLIQDALEASQETFTREVSDQISERMIKELDYQMRMQEEREEERFKKLQESLSSKSKFKKEAAAAGEKKEKPKRKGLFHRG
ncbi:MAG: helix-turn-helix domain-containing protein [Clostridiales bacterium]|nr:helix-turn-helix domain-containing protein [Clostridiales bacterium]